MKPNRKEGTPNSELRTVIKDGEVANLRRGFGWQAERFKAPSCAKASDGKPRHNRIL